MKIGLALGGGGAKGFAHIGVLRVLMDAGIKVAAVAGTSIGALVGAVFAADSTARLEEEIRGIKLTDIPLLLSPAWSLSGFFSGRNVLDRLNAIIPTENIEALQIPFAALSCDLNSSERVVFTSGNLHRAIRASFSIPAVFTPMVDGDKVLVDGGMVEPVPVETARMLGADRVIAVDLFGTRAPFRRESKLPAGIQSALSHLKSISEKLPWGERAAAERQPFVPNMIDIIERTLALYQSELTKFRLKDHPPDLLIQPEVSEIGLLDFHRAEAAIEKGSAAAKTALPGIKALLETMEGGANG